MKRSRADWIAFGLTGSAAAVLILVTVGILGAVVFQGVQHLSWHFVTANPSADMTSGGIGPAIFGTVTLTMLMTVAVVPVGIATAIYLTEYSRRGSRSGRWIRAAVQNLAGVPSIVFGLFGLGFFVLFVGGSVDQLMGHTRPIWARPSILWSSFTLAVLTLPVVIATSEEAIRSVPRDLRDAASGLGATQSQVIFRVVLPRAKAGILTGVILAISRGAGEVAPLIFTGVANYLSELPHAPTDMYMHLGYHVYALSTQSPDVDAARPSLFGTVMVLMLVTFALNMVAVWVRGSSRKEK